MQRRMGAVVAVAIASVLGLGGNRTARSASRAPTATALAVLLPRVHTQASAPHIQRTTATNTHTHTYVWTNTLKKHTKETHGPNAPPLSSPTPTRARSRFESGRESAPPKQPGRRSSQDGGPALHAAQLLPHRRVQRCDQRGERPRGLARARAGREGRLRLPCLHRARQPRRA